MARKGSMTGVQDLSSFMCIILMLIGVMVIVLVTNTIVILSNPQNIRITSIFQSRSAPGGGSSEQPFPFGNKAKEPVYVDVHKDHLVVYPGQEVVSLPDLERRGNALERLVAGVETNGENEYIVLLARPGTALVVHRLKKVIRDRGIDLGVELFEANARVEYERAAKASGKIK